MPYTPDSEELFDLLLEFELPELPEHTTADEDEEARDLILFRADDHAENVYLIERVTYQDAREYAGRDECHGDGWFVGFDRS